MLEQTVTEHTKHDPLNNPEQHGAFRRTSQLHDIHTDAPTQSENRSWGKKKKTRPDDDTGRYLKLKECEDS